MKHEMTQQQYVDFLNTLTREQQQNRTSSNLDSITSANTYVMSGSSVPVFRNGIRCDSIVPPAPAPVIFYCDINGNYIPNENDDGMYLASTRISWEDAKAYADWAGMRPMTELEYEKICRGANVSPTANAYAWGTTNIVQALGTTDSLKHNEIATPTNANAVYGRNTNTSITFTGPLRVGNFARETTTREQSGAAYYGALDMSGNVWEQVVTVGSPQGRSYTGLHGDGYLTSDGFADVTSWPDPSGSGLRGGDWFNSVGTLRISDRTLAAYPVSSRAQANIGFRAVITVE